ncbi:Phosphatidylinositol-3,4,5-trisphosphate 5-phosphatase 2A [Wickerhamomyces ciferrii]|uniref:Phosphatidylinositol-3,4,5-trisphosphate 5-phosphatase 2A n=1 Tax=Wickerhamomyces ciferrii (strain ATCC 14091 / BCRC 22168 / CBS 111 / JCM 3599 / NBRC 0793 / NRRL Y-1031 F-60-10) TaxID=1206466 RepID=K0KIT1_WICCF|nr:Phosphatidylinositol-3,4,5-trisphosphate 5-phosphatase 2A [Wickerhamomyces ciferrii]CCH45125.1 Phosphatidylinositol-3,4,5-trisphosphate 5-phosphatase 2A [Wickerhamomyces ciferrii]
MSLFLFTFNCAKVPQSKFQDLNPILPSTPPNLLIFGFQELVPILESTIPHKVNEELLRINDHIHNVLVQKYGDNLIHTVEIHHMGGIGMILMSLNPTRILNLKKGFTSCGILYSSLKGGIGLRFNYLDQEYTFVVAHLSANEGQVERRNQDSWKILKNIEFNDDWSVLKPGVHTYFMGDLNYRKAIYGDELSKQINDGEAFPGFIEEDLNFEPTYKFHIGSDDYNTKRISSWCDRILYLKHEDEEQADKPIYDSIPSFKTSDHKPVYLNISLPKILPKDIIDSRGYLINSDIYLKSTSLSKLNNFLMILGDLIIGSTLTLVGTPWGYFVLICLILAFIFWLF